MIHERLRKLREEHHLTQAELARHLHITASAYNYYENGSRQPSLETLSACADFYHVSLNYLYGITDTPAFFPIHSDAELTLLQRYRSADRRGRDVILYLSYHEYIRQKRLEQQIETKKAEREARRNAHKNPFLQH